MMGLNVINRPYYYDYLKDKSTSPTSCDDFIYGCCEYYVNCTADNETNTINANPVYINWEANVKHDQKGQNCDRWNKILIEYNTESTKDMSRYEILEMADYCTTFNNNPAALCCLENYVCDERYYYDFIIDKSERYNDAMFNYFHEEYGNVVLYSDNLFNFNGFQCPTNQEIQLTYENILINRNNKFKVLHPLILLVTLIPLVLCFLNKNCKRKESNQSQVIKGSA